MGQQWVKTGVAKLAEEASQRNAKMMNKGVENKKNGWRRQAKVQGDSEVPTRTK